VIAVDDSAMSTHISVFNLGNRVKVCNVMTLAEPAEPASKTTRKNVRFDADPQEYEHVLLDPWASQHTIECAVLRWIYDLEHCRSIKTPTPKWVTISTQIPANADGVNYVGGTG